MEHSTLNQYISFNLIQIVGLIFLIVVTTVSSTPTSNRLDFLPHQNCGRLITDKGDVIELLSTSEDNYWEKFQTKNRSHEHHKVKRVQLLTKDAVVRICNGYDNLCSIYENDAKISMDVKYIFSALCSTKKADCDKPKNCGDVTLEKNECARFYQDKNCNSCSFKSYGIPKNAHFEPLKFSYEVIGSIAVSPRCEARGIYFDKNNVVPMKITSGNIEAQAIHTHTDFSCQCK